MRHISSHPYYGYRSNTRIILIAKNRYWWTRIPYGKSPRCFKPVSYRGYAFPHRVARCYNRDGTIRTGRLTYRAERPLYGVWRPNLRYAGPRRKPGRYRARNGRP